MKNFLFNFYNKQSFAFIALRKNIKLNLNRQKLNKNTTIKLIFIFTTTFNRTIQAECEFPRDQKLLNTGKKNTQKNVYHGNEILFSSFYLNQKYIFFCLSLLGKNLPQHPHTFIFEHCERKNNFFL